ncbi:MAG: 16S rRNA (guanine(966)-N(2))-methyltransferase RsmD [Bacteroidetes bacterium HGW-Bacteroidetes-13]|nr:MAG: 16S rRNA (guanine(966)-N(2))-methyltransferase RsmD [Bacteroidetes bacterium HGW-Bacteroidetes-13]
MRIISGTHKSRKIQPPSKLPVRPTTDFGKESLFNLLNNQFYFDEISALDLCSGTGSIAYEFASRGCVHIDSVDSNRSCVQFIEKTAKSFDFPIRTFQSDLIQFLEKTTFRWDIIFVDPPYDIGDDIYQKIPQLVFDRNLLKENGLLVVEHAKETDLSNHPNYSHSKKYSNNVFSFFPMAKIA